MTNTVSKGTLRPAATARTRKAAQNTPLPGDAPETSAEEFNRLCAIPLSQQAKAIQARIRKLSNLPENTGIRPDAACGVTYCEKGLNHKGRHGKLPVVPAPEAAAPKPPRKLGSLAAEAEKAPAKSAGKAEALRTFLAPLGWKVAPLALGPGDVATLTAKRGTEVLVIRWALGVYDYPASSYARGDKTRKVINVSAAKTLAARPALEVVSLPRGVTVEE